MAPKLDNKSRGILSYRPNIQFVEPQQLPGEIDPIETPIQLEEVVDQRRQVRQLAKAVNILATAVQARADEKAKDMTIKLDPKVDAETVAAMKRMYGGAKGITKPIDPTTITYDQYKECKERMRKKGEELGERTIITPEAVSAAKDRIAASIEQVGKGGGGGPSALTQLGGFNTPAATNGGLRPDLNPDSQIIEPIDMEAMSVCLIRVFVNGIWRMFFKPMLSGLLPMPLPLFLPEEIAPLPDDCIPAEDLVNMGIPVIGYFDLYAKWAAKDAKEKAEKIAILDGEPTLE